MSLPCFAGLNIAAPRPCHIWSRPDYAEPCHAGLAAHLHIRCFLPPDSSFLLLKLAEPAPPAVILDRSFHAKTTRRAGVLLFAEPSAAINDSLLEGVDPAAVDCTLGRCADGASAAPYGTRT